MTKEKLETDCVLESRLVLVSSQRLVKDDLRRINEQ